MNVGKLRDRHLLPGRRWHQQVADLPRAGAILGLHAYDQVEEPLALDHLCRRLSAYSGLDHALDVGHIDAVAADFFAIHIDLYAWLAQLADHSQLSKTRNLRKYPLDLDIYYVITIPDGAPEDASFIQGFAPSLCRRAKLVRAATLLPSTIYDLTESGLETLLARRMSGAHPVNWHGQTPRAVRLFRLPRMVPFNVIMINPEDDPRDYKDWAASCVVPPVLVAESGGEITFNERTTWTLRAPRSPITVEAVIRSNA